MEYNFKEIEKRWFQYWKENKTYKTEIDESRPKYYVLDMFPYPDRKSTRLNSSHIQKTRMPSSA